MSHDPGLFVDFSKPLPEAPRGSFARVAIERSLDKVLDYTIPKKLVEDLKVGQRVAVPLGRKDKRVFGYVTAISPDAQTSARIKPILSIDDSRVLLIGGLMELAIWMSRYYCCPLGTVIDSLVPRAVKKRVGGAYNTVVYLAKPTAEAQTFLESAPRKRRAILARLLQLEEGKGIDLVRLASEAGSTIPTVRKLVKLGWIRLTSEADHSALLDDLEPAPPNLEPDLQLNEDQQRVFEQLQRRTAEGKFSINLLHGITGSGKTEIYLQCIRRVVEAGRQAIVLVPEIALTPQTVKRFKARFEKVAVFHSGMSASQRHRNWQRTWAGEAQVIVGARSAIFAPAPRLGMIVVDEEHDSSYKQDTAPRYHARDVAIKRAHLAGVPVVLGSATPSLESYWRATAERSTSHYLELPRRVRGLQLPHVELVDMKQDLRMRQGIHLISKRLGHLLETTVAQGQQAILLLNRRGYSNFIYCSSCGNVIKCKYCDVTMTYHRSAGAKAANASTAQGVHTGQMHCHYCLAVNPLPATCPDCGKKLSLFGLGTQRVEEELKHKLPDLKFARVDSDSMRNAGDYEKTLEAFGRGEIQALLGTQMIAKGLDFPNVTLVGVISGDTSLSLPDFRSSERTFQLITQVAGRCGRGDTPGRAIVQSFQPTDPTIAAAIEQDFAGFAQRELANRREVGLPPFSRMARIVMRNEDLDKLQKTSEDIAAKLSENLESKNVKMKGPMPCAINRIAGYHRYQILLQSKSPMALQEVIAEARKKDCFKNTDLVAVDVDPASVL